LFRVFLSDHWFVFNQYIVKIEADSKHSADSLKKLIDLAEQQEADSKRSADALQKLVALVEEQKAEAAVQRKKWFWSR
jgi:hypothetical protein